MKKRTRWLVIAGIAIVAILLISVFMTDDSLVVETHRVTSDQLVVSITEEGKTRVRERYAFFAPIAGRIGRM